MREFRALWFSQILSVTGDRLALITLALLVYDRTRSPLLAAVAYAAGYLPWVIGGLFLAGLADRRPRRAVMICCDVARAGLVAVMAAPRVPIAALVVLLFTATMFAPPFESARASITPDILAGEQYALGTAVLQTTVLAGQVAGAAAGGAAVAVLGVRPALTLDALTFVASALLIGLGTRRRPAAAASPGPARRSLAGLRAVFADPPLRTLMLFGWLVVFYTVPEGIAAPYAAQLGGGPETAGLILASTVLATAAGTPVFARLVPPARRLTLMGPLATATCATLMLTALRPGLAASLVIFSVSAGFGVYQIAANTAFVARVPNERRAQAFGIASMGVVVGQGGGFVAAGAAAQLVSPAAVIAVFGAAGAVTAAALTASWRRAPRPAAQPGGAHAAAGTQRGSATAATGVPRQAGPRLSAPTPPGVLVARPAAADPGTRPEGSTGRGYPGPGRGQAAASADGQRLPIFDSLESEWFRSGRKPIRRAGLPDPPRWTSPADEGWRAARAAVTRAVDDTTQAGLPACVPRAKLVPGSAGRAGRDTRLPVRSADEARDRLSAFQRGIREGRDAAPGPGD